MKSKRVFVTRNRVDEFKRAWPCSGLPTRGFWFVFDLPSGCLLDTDCPDADGSGALADIALRAAYEGRWLCGSTSEYANAEATLSNL